MENKKNTFQNNSYSFKPYHVFHNFAENSTYWSHQHLIVMKKLLFLITFLFLSVSALLAQNDYAIAGMNSSGTPIVADKHTFQETITTFTGDVSSDNVMIEFQTPYIETALYQKDYNKSTAIYYDFEHDEKLWEKTFDFTTSRIYKEENVIVMNTVTRSFILDERTGKEIWEFDHQYYFPFVDAKAGKCLLYRPTSNGNITLRGFDLNNHKTLWKKNMPSVGVCQVAKRLNDSIVLISARGLHRINVNTGEGWDYYAMKTKEKYIRFPAFGEISFIRSGTGASLTDSTGCVVFSSIDKFVKIDNNGVVLWVDTLDRLNTDYAIGIKSDTLFVISFGDHYFDQYEPPVFTAYDYMTGKRFFSHFIGENDQVVNSFHDNHNQILITFADKDNHCTMKLFDMTTGKLVKQKAWETNDSINWEDRVMLNKMYIKNDTALIQAKRTGNDLLIAVTNENIYKIDPELNIQDTVPVDEHYFFVYRYGNMRFFNKKNRTYIFDDNDNEVAWLDFKDFSITKTKIYTCIDKTVYAIDLNQIEGFEPTRNHPF